MSILDFFINNEMPLHFQSINSIDYRFEKITDLISRDI